MQYMHLLEMPCVGLARYDQEEEMETVFVLVTAAGDYGKAAPETLLVGNHANLSQPMYDWCARCRAR